MDPELEEIREEFVAEALEQLATVEDDVLALERGGDAVDPDVVNHLFRAIHTIKGGAGFLTMEEVTKLSHELENIVDRIRSHQVIPTGEVCEVLLHGLDLLRQLLSQPANDTPFDVKPMLEALATVCPAADTPAAVLPAAEKAAPKDTAAEPDSPEQQATAEDAQKTAEQRPVKQPQTAQIPITAPVDKTNGAAPAAAGMDHTAPQRLRVSVTQLDNLMNLVSELVLVRNQNTQATDAKDLSKLLAIGQRLNMVTSDLQTSIMQMRLQPVRSVFSRFTRVARDLARQLGKEVDLQLIGSEVELDKNLIEAIGNPLTHLIRNAVDHGIEDPDKREASGKRRCGTIWLRAMHQAGQVKIQIQDDGKGIDAETIKQVAIGKGILTAHQAENMTEAEAYGLVFRPGFSSAEQVTNVSGRGVGMDVVKSTFQRLGGVVDISSCISIGTTITITLPLTLAIVATLIVEVEQCCFALSQSSVAEVVWLHSADCYQKIEQVNDQEVFWLRDRFLPIVRLSKVLKVDKTFIHPDTGQVLPDRRQQRGDRRLRGPRVDQPEVHAKSVDRQDSVDRGGPGDRRGTPERRGPVDRRQSLANSFFIVVLKLGSERFGLLVDRIIDTEEIVVKALHQQLELCQAYSGTTILGDGRVALILDIPAIAKLAKIDHTNLERELLNQGMNSAERNHPVLLFDLGGPELFAVPLFLLERVERVATSEIQMVDGREYITLDDVVLPLVRTEQALSMSQSSYSSDEIFVIVPRYHHPIGLVAANILDTVEIESTLDSTTISRPGIMGSALIAGKLALFIDIFAAIQTVENSWFGNTNNGTQKRALVLEDSVFYASLIRSYLRGAGTEVVWQQNGEEGLVALDNEAFDFVISDLEMPVMNGFQFAQSVRKNDKFRELPMLAISSIEHTSVAKRARQAGFNGFYSKLDRNGMLSALGEMIAQPKVSMVWEDS